MQQPDPCLDIPEDEDLVEAQPVPTKPPQVQFLSLNRNLSAHNIPIQYWEVTALSPDDKACIAAAFLFCGKAASTASKTGILPTVDAINHISTLMF